MSKTSLGAIVLVVGVGLVIAISYTAGLWPLDRIPAGTVPTTNRIWTHRLEDVATAGILIGGVVALALAFWRGHTADLQARSTLGQVELSERRLLDDRYQKAAEMIGSAEELVRLAGIHALKDLAYSHSDEYYVQVIGLLCGFVRRPPSIERSESDAYADGLRPDILEAVSAIGLRRSDHVSLEPEGERFVSLVDANVPGLLFWEVNFDNAAFHSANLSFAGGDGSSFRNSSFPDVDFSDSEFSGCDFTEASFARADLRGADFSYAILRGATLMGTNCIGTNFENAIFTDVRMSGTIFGEGNTCAAVGLTQAQLDSALADPEDPPILEGVVDAVTGEPLVWRGRLSRQGIAE